MADRQPIGFRLPAERKEPPTRDQFEFYVFDTADHMRQDKSFGQDYDDRLMDLVNQLGSRGWQVIHIGPSSLAKDHERIYFQRPKL